jgi:phosphotriesterase-related protein
MESTSISGQAQTVLGAVAPEELGITMMHEHLIIDLRRFYHEPENPQEHPNAHAPVDLDTLSWVFMNWSASLDNLVLSDQNVAVDEAGIFKQAGGGTLVDVTSVGLGRDPHALRRIAEKTDLHIVMGSSYYLATFHPPDMDDKTEDDIYEEIVRDITEGVGDSGVRAGIIGEVGCSWPLHPNEAKALRASARAQRETGAPLSIHPGLHVDAPFEIVDILAKAGADIERVIIGHMERTRLDRERLVRLLRSGCYVEFDWFGEVRPTYPHGIIEVPSDSERIKTIAFLIGEGFGKKVVVSQDICLKARLASYGGPGYGHIARYVRTWMRELGIKADEIDDLLVGNPRRILAFA